MTRVPIGEPEGQALEFKAAEALRRPSRISREVVAMLNARVEGTVWIGIAEKDGRAVGVENIENVDAATGSLFDHLVESIEPSPFAGEVEVKAVEAGEISVIAVRVSPSGRRGPYAQLHQGGRHYLVRVGSRLRPMTREEVFATAPAHDATRTALDLAMAAIQERSSELAASGPGLWLTIRPVTAMNVELSREVIEGWTDPRATGNRAHGWSYAGSFTEFERVQSGWRIQRRSTLATVIQEDGLIEFRAPLTALEHDAEGEFYPLALLEYPVSVLRLARCVYSGQAATTEGDCLVGFALFGARGWKLRPFSPGAIGFWTEHPGHGHNVYDGGDDLVISPPLRTTLAALRAEDDRVGLRLVRRIYESFHHDHDAIPQEFDQEAGLLRLDD